MYIRSKLQQRAIENIAILKELYYPDSRVTKGFLISHFLENQKYYTENDLVLNHALIESENKMEGSRTAINLNVTMAANDALNELKEKLDKITGRSMFPAQIIDVLLICVLKQVETESEISDKQLAKMLLDFSYRLLTCELSKQEENLKEKIYKILLKKEI